MNWADTNRSASGNEMLVVRIATGLILIQITTALYTGYTDAKLFQNCITFYYLSPTPYTYILRLQ